MKIGVLLATICLSVQAQTTPGTDAQSEAKGLPPRAAPADYQAHVLEGSVTIAAEFTGHSIDTPQGPLTTDDYVVVETGFFGAAGARVQIAAGDFALRINGKKMPLPSQPYGLVVGSVKDPEYETPVSASKSKTSIGGSDKADLNAPPPAPPPIPFEVKRAMAQRVQKAALPEGDRALPQAGLLFFPYSGRVKGIHSIELIYSGGAEKISLTLQP
jgi:hypothetical protein